MVMVTKTEQMPSRRRANQREVVRNRNQASVQDKYTCDTAHKNLALIHVESSSTEADLSAGPDEHQSLSGTFPLLQRL